MVARLKGNCSTVLRHKSELDPLSEFCFSTIVGNKRGNVQDPKHAYDEVVLQQSTQAVPLFSFSSDTLAPQLLRDLHKKIQIILDKHLNQGRLTTLEPFFLDEDFRGSSFRKRRRIGRNTASPGLTSWICSNNALFSVPPRIFDPTSPLWEDVPTSVQCHNSFPIQTHIPQQQQQQQQQKQQQEPPKEFQLLGCFSGDTSLPPPFPVGWQNPSQPPQLTQPQYQQPSQMTDICRCSSTPSILNTTINK
jgi:hypothetical protein